MSRLDVRCCESDLDGRSDAIWPSLLMVTPLLKGNYYSLCLAIDNQEMLPALLTLFHGLRIRVWNHKVLLIWQYEQQFCFPLWPIVVDSCVNEQSTT